MKRRLFVMAGLVAGLAAPWWSGGALALGVSAADAKAIRATVQSQLEAFAQDDAVRAFGLATESARMQVGSPDNFLRMVREHYTPIYRNRLALFSVPEVIHGKTVLMVRLTDSDGRVWLAIYQMQQETDRSWKVDGCQLLQTSSVSV
jgi:hypothetical protein